MVTPNTNITLLKCPIELDSINQLTFSNATAQYNYFNSLTKLSYDNATYQRKEGVIRFPTSPTGVTYEDLLEYNYCMYQNTSYDDKWFYAYITKITYDNDGMSLIEIETDVFQTWQFDLVYKPSFIEREHVNDDTIGLHTLHEEVETGEYLPIDKYYISYQSDKYDDFYVCVGVTEDILTGSVGIHFYGNVPNGLTYIVVKRSDLYLFFDKYANAGKNSAINCLFVIPGAFVNGGSSFSWTVVDNIHYFTPQSILGSVEVKRIYIPRPTQLGTTTKYNPKNNKLLTAQFNFIMGDNQVGGTAPYYYEYFYDPTSCCFVSDGVLTPGCSIKCYPIAYKLTDRGGGVLEETTGFSEGLMASKLPIGSWNSDVYTNWLTQNGVNIGLQVASSEIQLVSGTMMTASGETALSGASNITSGALGIAQSLGEMYQHSLLPPQVGGNTNSGDIVYASQKSVVKYYRMTIKSEYAKIIDDYFSMYGYKVNSLKTPNITGRSNWNYVKTINCNILGDIPQEDMQKIKGLFNNGITLWHNANTFLDYSQNNNIV